MDLGNIKFEVIKKLVDTNFRVKNISNLSKFESNSPPSVFIGSKLKYPLVNVGILSPLERDENAWLYDAEKYWAENNFSINDVIQIRESLLNSRFQTKVQETKSNGNKFIQIAKEIAIASKPVDVEIELKRNLSFQNQKDRITTPHGMHAGLKKARITSNVRIHRQVDKVINDDIKASEGMQYLYKKGFDNYTLSKILSVGVLGLKTQKRLVPTRWSITATDDTLGKQLLGKIKDHKWIENYELFFGEFLGNQYLVLLFPNVWNYELFELYMPKSSWNPSEQMKASTDFESFFGRKEYASSTAGGYYATRLPILEYLESIKRQASVLAIRLETPSYWAGLGVWVVRESVKRTMKKKMVFNSKSDLIAGAKKISEIKYGFNPETILKRSKMMNEVLAQRKINEWV
ncbi:hypothetical protein HYT25_03220 [Candidatus Pacearchaeota archaeon]|nr:hypothetical protein [Candidatus Pacearchaeota archaeon]